MHLAIVARGELIDDDREFLQQLVESGAGDDQQAAFVIGVGRAARAGGAFDRGRMDAGHEQP